MTAPMPRDLYAPAVVIAHGAWADATGWREVIALLQIRGLRVVAVQSPLTGLAEDVDAVTRALNHQAPPVVLVCFLVLVISGSWHVASTTRKRFHSGNLIFYDSRDPLDCDLLHNWNALNLQLSEQFVRKWVPRPAVLSQRDICHDSQWGRVLASDVAQLVPEFVAHAPLPQTVLIDQLGALLALTASELSGSRVVTTPVERSVRDRLHEQIAQRCPDPSLQAGDVANALSMSTRTLHRALAACGETFGAVLIQARVDLAVRMLESPLFDHVTTAEIGRRAGFSDASHFVKVFRRRTGQTPLHMRRTGRG